MDWRCKQGFNSNVGDGGSWADLFVQRREFFTRVNQICLDIEPLAIFFFYTRNRQSSEKMRVIDFGHASSSAGVSSVDEQEVFPFKVSSWQAKPGRRIILTLANGCMCNYETAGNYVHWSAAKSEAWTLTAPTSLRLYNFCGVCWLKLF